MHTPKWRVLSSESFANERNLVRVVPPEPLLARLLLRETRGHMRSELRVGACVY